MAATGTPDAGHTRRHARGKKRKLTKAAERAATPAVLAIKTVPAQLKVGRRASQHRRNRKMKCKQKTRKAARRAVCGGVLQSAEDSKAVKVEHLSNFCTNVMAEVKIADQHAAQPCQTGQHFIKKEPIRMPAPTIKTDVLAPLFATDSGQEVPLASDAVKQEATCFACSTCSQNGATASFWQDNSQAVSGCSPQVVSEEAITDHRDMLPPPVAHSSGTASQSVKVQDEASSQGMVPPTTEAESGADPSSVKEVASHAGPAHCPCQHGTLAAPSAAETVVQLPQTKASPRKGSSSVSTSSLAAVFDSLPPVTDLSFEHDF